MKMNDRAKIVIAAFLMATLFGFSFLASKIGLNTLKENPIDLIAYRFLFAAIILYGLKSFGVIKIDLRGKDLKPILFMSMFYPVLSFTFEITGINMTSSAESGIIISFYPILTTILGMIVLKEFPQKNKFFFIFLSMFGVFFINVMQKEADYSIAGYIILMFSVLFTSIQAVLTRRASLRFKPQEITYIMIITGAIVFNTVSLITHLTNNSLNNYFTALINIELLAAISYLAIGSSIIGFFSLNYLYSKLEVSRISVLANIATIISIFAGVLILNEVLHWYHYIGAAMILLGAYGANYSPNQATKIIKQV
jgi:drug/metabolite transporter (DMT)-like permease